MPLAVWPGPIDQPDDDQTAPGWLTRLIAEYTPPTGRTLIYTADGIRRLSKPTTPRATPLQRDHQPHAPAGNYSPAEADLLVVLMHRARPAPSDIDRSVTLATTTLRHGGLLALVTRSRPEQSRPHDDLVARSVAAAADAGFGYLQHLIIANLPTAPYDVAGPSLAGAVDAAHRTDHLNIPIFRRLAASAVDPNAEETACR